MFLVLPKDAARPEPDGGNGVLVFKLGIRLQVKQEPGILASAGFYGF